jgi:hypothetical protein
LAVGGGNKDYLHSGGVTVYRDRGHAYEAKGLRGQAISDYRAALRLSPNPYYPGDAAERLKSLGVAPK